MVAVTRRDGSRRATAVPGEVLAALAVLAAVLLAGCVASPTAGDDGPPNRYESAIVTGIAVTDLERGVAADVTLRAGLFCPDTERRRFAVRAAFVGDETVLGWATNATTVPAEGNATVRLRVPAHVDVGAMRLIRVQAYRNETRSTPVCPEISDPGPDDATVETRFVANVTPAGFGPIGRAGPPDQTLRS